MSRIIFKIMQFMNHYFKTNKLIIHKIFMDEKY